MGDPRSNPPDAARPATPAGPAGDPGVGAPQDTAPKVDVFVSYNSKDHVQVVEVAEGLSALGLRPFLDRWDLEPGVRWRPELERVLASCGAVLVMLGPQGLGVVQEREVDVALRRQDKDPRFPVVPVLLPGAEPPGGFLEQLTWIDMRHQATPDAVADIARVIRKQWGADSQRAKAQTHRKRYLVNLLLLSVVLATGAAWYLRHLHTRLEHVAFGGTVTLPTLLWLAFLYFRWGAEEEVKSLPRRLLGSRNSTRGLAAALLVAVGLLVATSSVQVELAGKPEGEEPLRVELVSERGETRWRSPALSAEHPLASRLFFFRTGAAAELRLIPSEDREPIRTRLWPWSRVKVRVPDQFALRPINVVRLLPGGRLVQVLGKPGIAVNRRYDLAVVAGGTEFRIEDLRRQAVYLSLESADLDTGLARESETERQERFGVWAKARLALPEDRLGGFVAMWLEVRAVTGWSPPKLLEQVAFDLWPEGSAVPERLTQVILDGTNGIRTVWIDRSP